jgi:hypothetical protein
MSVNLASPGGAEFVRAYKGQVLDLSRAVIGSRTNESTTPVEFGRAVAQGASGGCVPVDGDHKIVCGLSVMNPIQPADYSTNAVNVKKGEEVALLEFGSMAVYPVENWADGDALYALTDQGGELGTASGGGASATRILVPGVRMKGAGTANTCGEVTVTGAQTITLGS